jgi:2'-hydroxyisoflavone reductase
MRNRREFLKQALVAVSALATGHASAQSPSVASRPLRILILGGTGNIGPYHVHAAVARGHRVAVFSRGTRSADLPASVEHLIGNRNGKLDAIENRDWDAVIDIATFGPAWVRSLAQRLKGRIKHYTFISTVSVYDKPEASERTTEDSPVLAYEGTADPYSVIDHVGADYGALKVLCEREAERQFPGATLILRPGYIGGPGDTNRALVYWPVRAEHGGEILVADDPATPVQYIDVRDMAEWAIRMIEKGATGTYNTVGPSKPANLRQIVDESCSLVASKPAATWVSGSWLQAQKDRAIWGTLFFWSLAVGNITRMSNERALAQGLTTRPVRITLADSLQWYKALPGAERSMLTTGHKQKEDGTWGPVTMLWPEYLKREREVLAAWRARSAMNAPSGMRAVRR